MKRGIVSSGVGKIGDGALILLCLAAVATFAGKLFWVFDLASHFQVYYFIAAVLLLFLNLVLRRRYPILIALVLIGVGVFHLWPYYKPNPKAIANQRPTYKVMQLNLNLRNQKTAAVKRAIADAKPDILVLQEVTARWIDELKSLKKDFKHQFELPENGAFGMWVLSNHEMTGLDLQRREGLPFFHIEYAIDGQKLEVVAMHPMAPVAREESRMRNSIIEAASVYASGEGSRMAVGDFNCSPWSPYFKEFQRKTKLRDSAVGRGIHSTWYPLGVLGIPIDHVLVSSDITVVDRVVGPDVGSDHRPLVVTFQFSPKKS